MARTARIVVPGTAHHVTQRGNRRQQTFFTPGDYARYIDLIADACRTANVEILAWCLMPNHVHLVAVPADADGLRAAFAEAHRSYTWTVNRRNGWSGHLWQERFMSCPMDDPHTIAAIRYVELNPVRARLVASPAAWHWSSARGRVAGIGDRLTSRARPELLKNVTDWLAFLAEGLTDEEADLIRDCERKGAVLGSTGFVAHLERRTGLQLQRRPPGRPPRANLETVTKMGTVSISGG